MIKVYGPYTHYKYLDKTSPYGETENTLVLRTSAVRLAGANPATGILN